MTCARVLDDLRSMTSTTMSSSTVKGTLALPSSCRLYDNIKNKFILQDSL